jgi:hypothetical protein
LARYSWTDEINLYRDVTAVYTDIRKITNNETVPVDVRVYITSTEKTHLLDYYRLSGNGTDFIIISEGEITLSNSTYYGLEPGQTLHFTVEAEGSDLLSIDDTAKMGVTVEFWSAEYIHDVAVTDIALSKTIIGQGFVMLINVTVQNQGNFTETFNVTSYANATIIQTQTVNDLASGDSAMVTFEWNTTEIPLDNYTISAVADVVTEETNLDNNAYSNGDVLVTIPGDVDGDRMVDIRDLFLISNAYDSTPIGPHWNPNADINSDQTIDASDITIICAHWGESW